MIVAPYQQPRLFPDRKVHRREHLDHALTAQPILGSSDQFRGYCWLKRLKPTPHSGARPHTLIGGYGQRQFINMRRYPANYLAAALGEEKLASRMFEEGIFTRSVFLDILRPQLRHEVRIAGIDPITVIDKGLDLRLAGNRYNLYFTVSHVSALAC